MSSGPNIPRGKRRRHPIELSLDAETHARLTAMTYNLQGARGTFVGRSGVVDLLASFAAGAYRRTMNVKVIMAIQALAYADAVHYVRHIGPDNRKPDKDAAHAFDAHLTLGPDVDGSLAAQGMVPRADERDAWARCYVDAFKIAMAAPDLYRAHGPSLFDEPPAVKEAAQEHGEPSPPAGPQEPSGGHSADAP